VIPVVADLSRTRPIARGLEAVAVKGIKAKKPDYHRQHEGVEMMKIAVSSSGKNLAARGMGHGRGLGRGRGLTGSGMGDRGGAKQGGISTRQRD